jgi:SIR2-like domain
VSSIGLTDSDWKLLLERIRNKECTPFIGAGACAGTIPLAPELAEQWAAEHEWPLRDQPSLAQVAQFLAIEGDPTSPKDKLREQLRQTAPPDFSGPGEPHGVLAELKLPIYLTTNYDSFMTMALEQRELSPRRELCRWNQWLRESYPSVLDGDFKPSPADPLVYHLHGYYEEPESMVLTENDYLQFLVQLSKDGSERLLPPVVRTALATTSLLFVGYSLSDWDFRVLFRGLMGSLGASLGRMSVAVQLEPPTREPPEQWLERAQHYLERYFDHIQQIKVRIYWGDARTFSSELSERWKAFHGDGG